MGLVPQRTKMKTYFIYLKTVDRVKVPTDHLCRPITVFSFLLPSKGGWYEIPEQSQL
jgi:hypothetical protein